MKKIDKLKLRKYKVSRKKGKSKAESLRNAGYAKTTAEHCQGELTLVKLGEAEILREYDISQINTEYVLKHLMNIIKLSISDNDKSNYNRAVESLGRHLAMFTDKTENKTTLNQPEAFQQALKRDILSLIPEEN